MNFLDKAAVPVQIHHGTADDSVPLEWSQKLEKKLIDSKKEVQLYVYENQPHEFTTSWSEVMSRTLEFFNSNLK